LDNIPDFLFVHNDILVVLGFQVVQFVNLTLQNGKGFTEGLEICLPVLSNASNLASGDETLTAALPLHVFALCAPDCVALFP
jgi:hypothetical protein